MDEIITPVKHAGGRPKGSTGHRSQLAREIMVDLNYDPLRALIAIAKRRKTPLDIKIKAAAAMLPFAHPKLSAVFVHRKKEVDIYVAQLQHLAAADPLLAEAIERVSLAATEASRLQLSPSSGAVIDVQSESSDKLQYLSITTTYSLDK